MSKGLGSHDAAILSESPAKTPRLDSGLLRNHLHPTLAGVAGRNSGDSPMRARLAALEMELEALKRGSDAGSGLTGADLAAAIKQQAEVLKDTLSSTGNQSSVTAVKADLTWPTLTNDRSDARDVSQFYEEFEDVCTLANNCKGMSFREQVLALRGRCRSSRLKTYTNVYRAAWKSGAVLSDPNAVYDRIKSRHLVFGESREEKEVRVDSEHALLMKGKLSGHQFEPLFEASIAELESVGLGKTPRELYLSYLPKMPAHLQKEIRSDNCGLPIRRISAVVLRYAGRRLGRKPVRSCWSMSIERPPTENRLTPYSRMTRTLPTLRPLRRGRSLISLRPRLSNWRRRMSQQQPRPRSISPCSRYRIRELVRGRRFAFTLGITVAALRERIALIPMIRSCASKPSQTEVAPVGVRPTRPLLARDPRAVARERPRRKPKPKLARKVAERERAVSPRSVPSSPRMGPAGGRELRYGALLARGAKRGSTAIDLDTAIGRQYGESLRCFQHPSGQRGNFPGGEVRGAAGLS